MFSTILAVAQVFFSAVVGFYFYSTLRAQRTGQDALEKESARELEKLRRLRQVRLTQPLSEKTRPTSFNEIRGQAEGIQALRAALCGPNPQHVLIYGPPGVGKTAAARVALAEAIKSPLSPFGKTASFIEADGATLRFDERGIADPLIGSVHDPIYQGAGLYGPGGIPQPKAGAVTKAHGGILFIDEIGELHPMQLNKLLKVLEDRRVLLESAYYSRDNKDIPRHIHEIFQQGLPADFRLVGATTRAPEELPPAIRSRCAEVFFSALSDVDLAAVAQGAVEKGGFSAEEAVVADVVHYAQNGRDAVNIIQTAGSFAQCEGRTQITAADIAWVAQAGRYTPRFSVQASGEAHIGRVRALAVAGLAGGIVMEIEAVAVRDMRGGLTVTGIVEREETEYGGRRLCRTGTAKAAVENALCVLQTVYGIDTVQYRLHVNFPGGCPADGPSAGLAIFAVLFSAIRGIPLSDSIAMTGELSPQGYILPVGGVGQKLEAAVRGGCSAVYIPAANDSALYHTTDLQIFPTEHVSDLPFFAKQTASKSGVRYGTVAGLCDFSGKFPLKT